MHGYFASCPNLPYDRREVDGGRTGRSSAAPITGREPRASGRSWGASGRRRAGGSIFRQSSRKMIVIGTQSIILTIAADSGFARMDFIALL